MGDDPTELQQEIINTAKRNSDMTNKEIAERVGCSDSHVSNTLNEYGDPREEGGGLVKILIIAAIVIGAFVLLSNGDSDGAESLLLVLAASWEDTGSLIRR